MYRIDNANLIPLNYAMYHLILTLSFSTIVIEAYTYKPAKTVSVTKGQSATFTCTAYPDIWQSGRILAYYAKNDKYLCRDPCGPHDWHLIVTATDKTLAPNGDPRFTITKLPTSNGAQITISEVKSTNAGTYWCGIEYPSSDMYRQLRLIVDEPQNSYDTSPNMLSNVKAVSPASETEDNHLDDINVTDHKDDAVQQALRQCNDNNACALALLHKKQLKIPGLLLTPMLAGPYF